MLVRITEANYFDCSWWSPWKLLILCVLILLRLMGKFFLYLTKIDRLLFCIPLHVHFAQLSSNAELVTAPVKATLCRACQYFFTL